MRVLLTGANGFTGRYVAEALAAQGHEVAALKADLRDRAAMAAEIANAAPEAVMHLAAQAFVAHDDANAFYEINLIGTNNLLSALAPKAADLRHVVLASSAAVYGNRREGVLREDMAPDPVGHYAVSKLAMEHAARVFADLPISVVRPFNYTGVGQAAQFVIPKIVSHFRDRAPVISLGNTDVFREFGDVRRVAELYARLIGRAPVDGPLNFCTGVPYALNDVLELCAEISGHRLEVQVNPAFVRKQEVRSLTGDPAKLEAALGPLPAFELRDTLSWMLA